MDIKDPKVLGKILRLAALACLFVADRIDPEPEKEKKSAKTSQKSR